MSIARKEAYEIRYRLRLLKASEIVEIDVANELSLVEELIRLLTSIIISTKDRREQRQQSSISNS